MKGVLVILDGLGDLPCSILDKKTPLEAANTPNLDFLATRGEMGLLNPVRPGFAPGSDEALVSIFGNDLINSTRGQLEVRGTELKLTRGDLAFRVNFATIDSFENGNVIDRRVGRTLTTAEAQLLAKSLNKIQMPVKFVFHPTVQHRGVLVFRGGFSDNLTGNEPFPFVGKFRMCQPTDEDENSQYTVNIVNEFLKKAYEVLENHPINVHRKNKGLMPANFFLIRGAGIEAPELKQYKNWVSPSYMPLEIGFSKLSGMKTVAFDYPKLKKIDVYGNLYDGLKKACKFAIKTIKKNHKKFDYAYIHLKEIDIPGHDNKPVEKKTMIEYVDKTLFKFLRKFAPPKEIHIAVTGDHSTPCKLKAHSADPVPLLLYNCAEIPKERKFCEKEAKLGSLGRMNGKELLKRIGFDK